MKLRTLIREAKKNEWLEVLETAETHCSDAKPFAAFNLEEIKDIL